MSEMVDRVARAICQAAYDRGIYDDCTIGVDGRPVNVEDVWPLHRNEARAAIVAVMREPYWRDTIDAALK